MTSKVAVKKVVRLRVGQIWVDEVTKEIYTIKGRAEGQEDIHEDDNPIYEAWVEWDPQDGSSVQGSYVGLNLESVENLKLVGSDRTEEEKSPEWEPDEAKRIYGEKARELEPRWGDNTGWPAPWRARVVIFKDTGKYYTGEYWEIPEDAIGPYDMRMSPDARFIDEGRGWFALVATQEPWGFPYLLTDKE